MRQIIFAPGEYYHLYNRGTEKRNIFLDDRDYARFLLLLLVLQAPNAVSNFRRLVSFYVQHSVLNIEEAIVEKMRSQKTVELVNFTLMPNHFHLTVREVSEGGISKYMQRLLNGYTKYFNTRYNRSGHLMQGPFHAVHVKNNEQLLYLSTYIHRNPREIGWENKEHSYPWSSYKDYLSGNTHQGLLCPEVVMDQFSSPILYKEFTDSSPAKALEGELLLVDHEQDKEKE